MASLFRIAIVFLSLVSMALAQSPFDAIERLVIQAIDEKKLPGAVILIGGSEETYYQRAFGNRQLLPQVEPMAMDTVFDLASLTKPMATATAILQLIEQRAIALDEPVSKHIPEFAANGKESITIQQLLLHTGGLIPDNAMSDYRGTRAEMVARLFDLHPQYEPGAQFRYSDVSFQVLGELVERKSGQNIAEFSRLRIYEPLGMKETGYLPSLELKNRCAATQQRDGYWMVGEVHDPRAFAMNGIAGHAGLFSTAADMAKYARMILGKGIYQNNRILNEDSIALMIQSYEVPGGTRGLGWDKQTAYSSNRGRTMSTSAIGHGGFTGTGLWIDPDLDLFVVFLSNRVHPDGKGNVNPLIGEIGTIAADYVKSVRK